MTTPAISLAMVDEGTYQIQVVVTKTVSTGTVTATGSSQLVVADAALTAGAAVALSPHTGVALPTSTIVGTFTDANATAPATDFTATIDWGDGTAPTSGNHHTARRRGHGVQRERPAYLCQTGQLYHDGRR